MYYAIDANSSPAYAAYFIFVVLMGHYVFNNIFIAVVMEGFTEQRIAEEEAIMADIQSSGLTLTLTLTLTLIEVIMADIQASGSNCQTILLLMGLWAKVGTQQVLEYAFYEWKSIWEVNKPGGWLLQAP